MANTVTTDEVLRCCPHCFVSLSARTCRCPACDYSWGHHDETDRNESVNEVECCKPASTKKTPKLAPTVLPEKHVRCHTTNCGGVAQWRGLCGCCYGAAKNFMRRENLEWDDLTEMDLIPASPFEAAARAARARKAVQAAQKAR